MDTKKIVKKFLIYSNLLALIFTAFIVMGMGSAASWNIEFISNAKQNAVLNNLIFAVSIYIVLFGSMAGMLFWSLGPMIGLKLFQKADSIVSRQYEDSGDSIYNRDLPEYNAAIAGYLIDYTTDAKQDYIALYISLIERGYIKRDFDGKKIGEDVSEINGKTLSTSELFVLNTYTKFKHLTFTDFFAFKQAVMKEVVEKGFIKDNSKNYETLKTYADRMTQGKANPRGMLMIYGYIMISFVMSMFAFIPFPFNFIFAIFLIAWIRKKFSMKSYTESGKIEKEKMGKLRFFMMSQTDLKNKDINDKNFLRFIPYAVAFDVNNIYQEKFTDILNNLE